jgi:hypothetical protein
VNTKVSFLFSPKEAASIDGETIWSLGQSGLAELAAMDGRFRTYEKNIFSREGLKTHRENESEWPLDLQPRPSAPSQYAENNLCHYEFVHGLLHSLTRCFPPPPHTFHLPAVGYNERLDKQLESYLILLSPLFMLQPAHKTMEYLVRRYR